MALNPTEGAAEGQAGEQAAAKPSFASQPLIPKEYYSIGEVCDLLELKPHVLRYWETQFTELNPSKNRSGNRVYQRKEIKLLMLVRHLLHEEKYTIEGAKQKIMKLRRGGKLEESTGEALERETAAQLREDLAQALRLLSTDSRE